MKKGGGHIDFEKLTAFIAGEGNAGERKAIEQWIDASEENRKVYEEHKKVFNLDYALGMEDDHEQQKKFNFDTDLAWKNIIENARIESGNDETIKLEHETGDTESAFRISKWIKMAASVLIGVSLIYYLIQLQGGEVTTISFTEGIHEYYLADSSKVVFQGRSTIVFEDNFSKDHRTLRLTGQAYFDVRRNEEIPFIINTALGQVKVLGTAFLITETPQSLTVEVEKGKVSMAPINDLGSGIILEREDKGTLYARENKLEKSKAPDTNHLYWANRKLTYRQQTLQSVLEELSIIFNKEIVYNTDMISDCRITGVFKDQDFEDIIRNLSVSLSFEYTISGNQIEIISNGCHQN